MNNTDDLLTQVTDVIREACTLTERFVLSWEKLATSIAQISEDYKRQTAAQYPERSREIRDAVISRVPNDEDRIREEQGASGKPITEWLSEPLEDGEEIGVREREWLRAHPEQDAGSEEPGQR